MMSSHMGGGMGPRGPHWAHLGVSLTTAFRLPLSQILGRGTWYDSINVSRGLPLRTYTVVLVC